jgi:5-methylcytosine-specific restriction endonuclease McrA
MVKLCECGCGQEVKRQYVKGHYCIGKKQTEETKLKNRLAHLGRPSAMKGMRHSEAALSKIKEARARQVMVIGRKHTDEAKRKNRVAHLGKSNTAESNKKRSTKLLGVAKSDTHRENISKSKKGSGNHRWLGGIAKLPYSQDWTEDLKDAIRKRDGYTCKICGKVQGEIDRDYHKKLTVHHIDYDKKNCNPTNLISLCVSCHAKTGTMRRQWLLYFGVPGKGRVNGDITIRENNLELMI